MNFSEVTFLIFEIIALLLTSLKIILESLLRLFIPNSVKSVQNEIVLITGSGHGLGKELALNFAKLGATVVLWDINMELNTKVANEIKKNNGKAFAYQCDITDDKQVESLAHRVRQDVGDVTILINNAGILQGQQFLSLNNQQIRRTIEINLLGHFWTTKAFLPRMLELCHGHIVAVSSIAGFRGTVNMTDYCATKFGIRGFMDALEEELVMANKDHCIKFSTVFPLTMNTGLSQRPRTRFPRLLPILKVDESAKIIVDGILRNKRIIFHPSTLEYVIRITGLFPLKVVQMFQHFFDYATASNLHGTTDIYVTNMKRRALS